MKTKSILILLSAVFFSLILTACGSLRDPNDYENEIRDAFCYNIAKAMYYVENELSYDDDYPFIIAFSDSRAEHFFENV